MERPLIFGLTGGPGLLKEVWIYMVMDMYSRNYIYYALVLVYFLGSILLKSEHICDINIYCMQTFKDAIHFAYFTNEQPTSEYSYKHEVSESVTKNQMDKVFSPNYAVNEAVSVY